MKIIGSVIEDLKSENRISITPETSKKLKDLNFSVFLEKNYGEHLGIKDSEYEKLGANIYNSKKEIFDKSEIILKVNCPKEEDILLSFTSTSKGKFIFKSRWGCIYKNNRCKNNT